MARNRSSDWTRKHVERLKHEDKRRTTCTGELRDFAADDGAPPGVLYPRGNVDQQLLKEDIAADPNVAR